MNVLPISGPNHLPLIQDRGFVGVLHDWLQLQSIEHIKSRFSVIAQNLHRLSEKGYEHDFGGTENHLVFCLTLSCITCNCISLREVYLQNVMAINGMYKIL